jgi:iron complex transport system permease protein
LAWRKSISIFVLLAIATVVLFVLNLTVGSAAIPVKEVFSVLAGGESKPAWEYIVLNYRLPKAVTAVIAGMALSICGLTMQTLFRNPLAGPYVLGISSGSSLGVALLVMGSGLLPSFISDWALSPYGAVVFSCLGSLAVLAAVVMVSERVTDTASILIAGLMFSSFTGAIVGVLSYLTSAEQLQKFTFWSMGNLGDLSWNSVVVLAIVVTVGLIIAFATVKPLDALLLGDTYAMSLGVKLQSVRRLLIVSSALLAGAVTAFAGPIAFVGIAVPHMAKLTFGAGNHRRLFFATLIYGAAVMLICDMASNVPGTDVVLPINALTSILGAPVVIWLVLRKRNVS